MPLKHQCLTATVRLRRLKTAFEDYSFKAAEPVRAILLDSGLIVTKAIANCLRSAQLASLSSLDTRTVIHMNGHPGNNRCDPYRHLLERASTPHGV